MLVLFNKETFNEEVCTYYSGQKRLEYCGQQTSAPLSSQNS